MAQNPKCSEHWHGSTVEKSTFDLTSCLCQHPLHFSSTKNIQGCGHSSPFKFLWLMQVSPWAAPFQSLISWPSDSGWTQSTLCYFKVFDAAKRTQWYFWVYFCCILLCVSIFTSLVFCLHVRISDFVLLWVLFVCMHFVYLFFVVVLFSNCFLKKETKKYRVGRVGR